MSIVECMECGLIAPDNDFDGDFDLVEGHVVALCIDCITDGASFT